ncbi:F0F1 ATP synthase subunit gamma [Paramagnetospirillum magneticum]|uniref:ATP synthase gamma chain n=1 Tax=Paramagnetospirillum magneticum (strain ATCC 700264 / AMB-1) TaxID=342108 RepID=ATPG_PARM1|nr:F0F1 ATP synthase subunit gamma [Paramagnetospirillum magneticum]Q2VZN1.1 RecName: Full=ATP synthase gamma chain; AltName: Full=ATP synthase F1 sector gamma subunit; AltName: Full=F-ATPase gamma subunit [Paramagnetospirillum magneticum AMB-1]BAE52944.1 F0F1-type ATP synthase, gamma subunit [Paramagnetospirillum magneticum AMB-1]
MASLKDLRMKIVSVKSTRKITSAMKMVAASKLRRAQTAAEAARPFAERMERMLGTLAASLAGQSGAPRMISGTGFDKVHLLVAVTADRGLCGGFNSSIVRATKAMAADLLKQGKTIKIMPVGRKAREQLRRDYGQYMIEGFENLGRKGIVFAEADQVASQISAMFDAEEFDVCTVVYNKFKSAIAQEVTRQQVIPFPVPEQAAKSETGPKAIYEFEPSEEEILAEILPRNLATQMFRALLESQASEQGARMTAMDNATRNAGDMINALAIKYNRSRQAQITKELIEIISGAEAL